LNIECLCNWLTEFYRGRFVNYQGTDIVVLPDDGV